MSLRVVAAVPFKGAGSDRLAESEFVVKLSLERDWFSPDEASRAAELAVDRDLLARDGDDLRALFDPHEVEVPDGFEPGADVLREQTVFEVVLERVVADGVEKGAAVAAINDRQRRLGVTAETAAVLEARSRGLDVDGAAERVLDDLRGEDAE